MSFVSFMVKPLLSENHTTRSSLNLIKFIAKRRYKSRKKIKKFFPIDQDDRFSSYIFLAIFYVPAELKFLKLKISLSRDPDKQ